MEYRRDSLTVSEIKRLNNGVLNGVPTKDIEDSLYLKKGLLPKFVTPDTYNTLKNKKELKDFELKRMEEILKCLQENPAFESFKKNGNKTKESKAASKKVTL